MSTYVVAINWTHLPYVDDIYNLASLFLIVDSVYTWHKGMCRKHSFSEISVKPHFNIYVSKLLRRFINLNAHEQHIWRDLQKIDDSKNWNQFFASNKPISFEAWDG